MEPNEIVLSFFNQKNITRFSLICRCTSFDRFLRMRALYICEFETTVIPMFLVLELFPPSHVGMMMISIVIASQGRIRLEESRFLRLLSFLQ